MKFLAQSLPRDVTLIGFSSCDFASFVVIAFLQFKIIDREEDKETRRKKLLLSEHVQTKEATLSLKAGQRCGVERQDLSTAWTPA